MGLSSSTAIPDYEVTVLPSSMGGGPKGLGDPEDRSLRHVETDIMIPTLIRELLRTEYCRDTWDLWGQCSSEKGWRTAVSCRKQLRAIKDCSEKVASQPDFRDKMTERYLAMRAEYRRTGKGQKVLRNKSTERIKTDEL